MQKSKPRKNSNPSHKSQQADAPAKTGGENAAPKNFFQSLGDGIKAAGQAAEKYTRIGVRIAELEKLRIELKLGYARLGEGVSRCWDAAPDIGVTATDPAVKLPVREINDLRRRIRETEIKIQALQQEKK